MRAQLPTSRALRAAQQLSAATQVKSTREAQVTAAAVTDLETVTSGLDVGAIDTALVNLDTRVSALEAP